MKRSELKVGEAYYYDRSQNWAEGGWGGGEKAVVVDDQRYSIRRDTWGFRKGEKSYYSDPKGSAVLVDVHRLTTHGEVVDRKAVPAAHLRGPWEETKAAVDRRAADIDAAKRAAEQRRELDRRKAGDVSEAAEALGVKAGRDWRIDGNVTVRAEQFAAMVATLAAQGWRYEGSGQKPKED